MPENNEIDVTPSVDEEIDVPKEVKTSYDDVTPEYEVDDIEFGYDLSDAESLEVYDA